MPAHAALALSARSEDTPAHVSIHPTYEGVFRAESARDGGAVVQIASGVEDPSGAGRRRRVEKKTPTNRMIEGFVTWEGGSEDLVSQRGSVRVQSWEQATLVL